MATGGPGRFQRWFQNRDRNNQIAVDAMRPPSRPPGPALVLEALSGVPDPAFAYPVQLVVDGERVEGVPWGWSVHPLPPGKHVIELHHRSGLIPRASRAKVSIELDEQHPVLHLAYKATVMGVRRARVTVTPYATQGAATSDGPPGPDSA